MEERKKLTQMLKDFQAEQKELLVQAEQRLEVMVLIYCEAENENGFWKIKVYHIFLVPAKCTKTFPHR